MAEQVRGVPVFARRELLKGAAALLVSLNVPLVAWSAGGRAAAPTPRNLDPARLDTWLAIRSDGCVTGYWGKMDMGQGVDTAIAQIVADELDVPVDAVDIVFGDTARCADQGGASGSNGLKLSGRAFRAAAAEARLALLEQAAAELGAPRDELQVVDGVVSVKGRPSPTVSYADLVRRGAPLAAPIQWNGKYGNALTLSGRAKPKPWSESRVVGTSVPRKDIRDKLLARATFLHDHSLPGMLHGRLVRPRKPGACVRRVDRDSLKDIPGVEVVVDGNFIGVVAPREWDAIRAARQLAVDWDEADSGFATDSESLHDWIRRADAVESAVEHDNGDVDAEIAAAARTLIAEYEWPFQSHARMAPAAAIADVRDGHVTIWTDSQKPWDTARGAAALLGDTRVASTAADKTYTARAIWMPGPGSYGRSDAGDGAMDAVLLSEALHAPVRVQWMRDEGHGWDPKGPASVVTCRGAIDSAGGVRAYHFHIKGFSRHDQNSREDSPGEVLAGHLVGHDSTPEWTVSSPDDSYVFPAKRYSWQAIAPLRRQASPLRTAHFRDPYGPETHFASESFIDELAYAAGTDPLEFRLARIADERDAAVLRTAAELSGWQPRTAPRKRREADGRYVGTGIAYAQRSGSVNAVVAETVVDPGSGRIHVRRIWVGADHGLVVNPFTLDRTIEGNLLQAMSRTLFEEVQFTRDGVRSLDWQSYPILEAADAPDDVQIRHVNRPELGPQGAGEPTTRVMPAAIANAVFDATGVRLRRVPFTPARVKAALG
jgi:CO/xanthine dehydrogenase Mo-binding subunit